MEVLDPILGFYDPFLGRQAIPCERSELPAQPSSLECAACAVQVTPGPICQQAGVACYASELEQDIAALEEEANRAATMDWDTPTSHDGFGSCVTSINKLMGNDVDSYGRDQVASDSSSDDESDQPEDDLAAQIHANARMVQQCGKPLQQGAWKGCTKSAWCDREDRHRGLCNHKATLPGPAACAPAVCTPCSEDACSTDDHDEACCDTRSVQQQQQQSSGGHSHNCQRQETGDEKEVASALKAGPGSLQASLHEASMPFSCLPQSQQQTEAALQQPQQTHAPGLFWDVGSGSSRFAVSEQLFALPAIYQPRVKDLEAPDISSMLNGDGLCSMEAEPTNIEVPVVEPVELDELDTSDALETSCQTYAKPSHSSPSSPSYASAADKAQSGAFSMPVPVAVVMLPGSNVPAALLAVPSGCLAPACLPGMLPLKEVHPPSMPAAAASKPAAATTDQSAPAATTSKSASIEVAKPSLELLRRCSSSGSSANQAAVEAAAAAPATTAALEPAATVSPKAAASVTKPSVAVKPPKAAAAAAAPKPASTEPKLPPPMQRVPRIKHKPRRADDPPRPLLEPSSSAISSPKAAIKKRPAGRMAANPSSEHCCAQCGAVSTPVWRAGPAGPKTLCNACGVRYMKTARRK